MRREAKAEEGCRQPTGRGKTRRDGHEGEGKEEERAASNHGHDNTAAKTRKDTKPRNRFVSSCPS
jgi:hypothetical protein